MSNASHYPGQNELLETPAPGFTAEEVKEVARKLYGLSGALSPLDSERDQNFRIITEAGDQFVIKIANNAEDAAVIDMQARALQHIARVDPGLPVPRVLSSRNGLAFEEMHAEDGTKHWVRILTYLMGSPPRDNPTQRALLRPVGACLARLALALRGFFHPAADLELLWDLKHASRLRGYLAYLGDATHRELARYFLDGFDERVLPEIPKLRAQIVHNDVVPDNLLVAEDDPGRIAGVIDFGDMTHTSLINDLATSIAPMICGHEDPTHAAAEIVDGYQESIALEPAELRLLYDLIGTRLTMLGVIAGWRGTIHPENSEYITGGVEHVWRTLEVWRAQPAAQVTRRFFRVCGLWEMEEARPEPMGSKETLQAHLSRRARLLGPCYYLSYDQPLHIVRGQGVWLYDDEGNRYLDVYNNVAHVGHCHPQVVNAIARQARRLNTNTRYMHTYILELAERITGRLPEPLSVCMFVCTGSEANELAWRMTKLASGHSGALITGCTYHGNSDATIQFSTEEIPKEKQSAHVQTLLAPTSNESFVGPDSGIGDALLALGERGHQPAMLLLDTGFTSDGIYISPRGYLRTLYAKTRAGGGLCVADEVQAGFGRLGKHFWGFEFDDVVPDIVTMAKPMGNGHPVAAVVTRPEISEALAAETGYFNTFGGNPVACAAGLAVLDVIERENLVHNALQVGQYLQERLAALREEYPALGDAHGAGLLQGVDILKPDGAPAPELADRMMNHMRQNGVLIGTTGPHGHVLKLRPPMVFRKEHADILLAALVKALNELV
jgi:4-aminobutyrate aminotransferase-like enzyme/Ser/Thr protein kinase RdoA (MazF antagonist)